MQDTSEATAVAQTFTYLSKTKTTVTALQFAQILMKQNMADDFFEAKDLEDAIGIAEQNFLTNSILENIISAVKQKEFSFAQLLKSFNNLDVIDTLLSTQMFTHLHYLEAIKLWENQKYALDYKVMAKESDAIFKEIIQFVQLKNVA